MCHSGVGLTPIIDGKTHHFSAGGLYNGLVLLIDDETRTYWNHTTGEAVHGPLKGKKLDTWFLDFTTVGAALKQEPELQVSRPSKSLVGFAMSLIYKKFRGSRGFFPPRFRSTMGEEDKRLPSMTQGLGVIEGKRRKFYPIETLKQSEIKEKWGERTLTVKIDEESHTPKAFWDDGTRPMQLFTRWYGFSYTHPDCEIAD